MMQCALDFTAFYPPHQQNSDTSRESAKAVAPKFSSRMVLLLDAIYKSGNVGVTDEEGQARLSIDGNSYRPARVILSHNGMIRDSEIRRKTKSNRNAAVWVITEKGSRFLRQEQSNG